jgi:hypothetical protein
MLGLGLDNGGRTTKKANRLIYSLWIFSPEGLAIIKTLYRKMEKMKTVKKLSICNLVLFIFGTVHIILPKEIHILQEQVRSFNKVQS